MTLDLRANNLGKTHKIELVAVGIFFFCVCLFFKNDFHPAYWGIYDYVSDPKRYLYDFYYGRSILISTSWFYGVAAPLHFENDFVVLVGHVLLAGLAFYYALLLIEEVFEIRNPQLALAVAVVSMHTNDLLALGPCSGIVFDQAGFPSEMAAALTFPLVYYAIRREVATAACVSAVMVLTAVKSAWFPTLVFMADLVLTDYRRPRRMAWVLVPCAVTLGLMLVSHHPLPTDYNTRLRLAEFALVRDGSEDALNLQPPYYLAIMIAAAIGFVFLLKHLRDGRLRWFATLVYVLTILIQLGGVAYTTILYKYFPNPLLIMIAPMRSIALFQLFFVLVLASTILSQSIRWSDKAALLCAIFLFAYSPAGKAAAFLLVGVVVFVPRIPAVERWGNRLAAGNEAVGAWSGRGLTPPPWFLLAMVVVCTGPVLWSLAKKLPEWDIYAVRTIGKWNTPYAHDTGREKAAFMLRRCRDFPMLAVPSPPDVPLSGDVHADIYLNEIAWKSKFIGDPGNLYLEPKLLDEHYRRRDLVDRIDKAVADGRTPGPDVIATLRAKDVVLFLDDSAARLFSGVAHVLPLRADYSLVYFSSSGHSASSLTSCPVLKETWSAGLSVASGKDGFRAPSWR